MHTMHTLSKHELLTLGACALESKIQAGLLTSVELVSHCLDQIQAQDRSGAHLRAVVNTAPRAALLTRAKELDDERQRGFVRSRLHGIPILIKDNIATNPKFGLPTTVGSIALEESRPRKTSPIVDKLDEMGAIILAKTNLNELIFKAFDKVNGWSAVAGQTQSAYIAFDPTDTNMGHTNPCGSSTGSAVGVSAGYAPIALGTDTTGSLVSPATRAALYSLKPTIGTVDLTAVYPTSQLFDMAGGITKTVIDLAILTTCLVNSWKTELPRPRNFEDYLTETFDGLRIGFLDPRKWMFPDEIVKPVRQVHDQIKKDTEAVIESIRKHRNVHVEYPVDLPPISALERDGRDTMKQSITYEMAPGIAKYLQNAGVENINTLEDVVQFNKDHADKELPKAAHEEHPKQDWLVACLHDRPTKEDYDLDVAHFQRVARADGFDKLFKDKRLDTVAFSTDSLIMRLVSAAGYPIATVPQGLLAYNGRPFGLGIVAQPGREDLMFQFMSAYEAHFPPRAIPTRLLSEDRVSL